MIYSFLIICLLKFINTDMNYIINNMYLGDTNAAGNETYLEENNITVVVNCASGYSSNYKRLKSLELNLKDYPTENLFPKFDVAYKFVKEYKENNILIHCLQGKSRSPSFVIFYLMKEKRWDYDTCMNFVKEKRPIVSPNAGFVTQLKEYYDKFIKNK